MQLAPANAFPARRWSNLVNIEHEIETASGLAWQSMGEKDASIFLAPIIDTLIAISEAYRNGDSARCRKLASGLNRLTAEDAAFKASGLGKRITGIAEELSK